MVQRYLLQGGLIGPHDEGDWVGYEDYEDLYAVLCLLTDQVNLCELPDSLCEKLEAMGLL